MFTCLAKARHSTKSNLVTVRVPLHAFLAAKVSPNQNMVVSKINLGIEIATWQPESIFHQSLMVTPVVQDRSVILQVPHHLAPDMTTTPRVSSVRGTSGNPGKVLVEGVDIETVIQFPTRTPIMNVTATAPVDLKATLSTKAKASQKENRQKIQEIIVSLMRDQGMSPTSVELRDHPLIAPHCVDDKDGPCAALESLRNKGLLDRKKDESVKGKHWRYTWLPFQVETVIAPGDSAVVEESSSPIAETPVIHAPVDEVTAAEPASAPVEVSVSGIETTGANITISGNTMRIEFGSNVIVLHR